MNRDRPGTNLVEARAAVDGPIVPRGKGHHRLAAAAATDRRVELTRAAAGSRALCDGAAGRASLWVVQESFAGKEGLFAAREDELFGAVPARKGSVLVHALPVLLWRIRPGWRRGPPGPCRTDRQAGASRASYRSLRATAPELMSRRIAAPSRGLREESPWWSPTTAARFESPTLRGSPSVAARTGDSQWFGAGNRPPGFNVGAPCQGCRCTVTPPSGTFR